MPNNSTAVSQLLPREKVSSFIGVMQAVYGILMILGFREAFQIGYQRLFPSLLAPTYATFNAAISSLALFSISLVGIRFFWVPRTLLRFLDQQGENMRGVLRLSMSVYLPVTLLHATLFYFICRAYEDVAAAGTTATPYYSGDVLGLRLLGVVGLLLLVNSAWLLWIAGDRKPAVLWALNNMAHAVVLLGVWLVKSLLGIPADVLVVVLSGLLITNSILDLASTGECYILMESEPGALTHSRFSWFGTFARWIQRRQAAVSKRLPA